MKKNISINIGGIIFHIEEEGFDKLKNYLDNINAYFADFEDSQEIISDIENRIAEIFLQKLKEDKQIINSDDVKALMTTLGSIADFQEAEKNSDPIEEEFSTETDEGFKSTGDKKLHRDIKRKILGGVAAGVAHYFKIDPLWIRLALLVLTVLTLFAGVGFLIIIAYIILWIALPSDPFLAEAENIKKLYRGKDGVVIAGVAKGLSAYFGVDVAIIRLLFVLTLFLGGTGFFIYLVLWLITPKVNSLTEKMQMEGTPVTLANIEKSIKSNFNMKEGEESTLVKVLLFPFRLAAIVLNALAKVLGPVLNVIVDIIRIIVGIILLGLGLLLGTSSIGLSMFSQGWFMNERIFEKLDAPIAVITNSITTEVTIVSMLLLLIPAIFIAIAGTSVLAKKWLLNKTVGFTLLGIYFISLIAAAIIGFNFALEFSEKATLTDTKEYKTIADATLLLNVKQIGFKEYKQPTITLYGYEGNTVKLEKSTYSRGFSRQDALEKATMLLHEVRLENDSILLIDSDVRFKDSAVFREQKIDMKLYIPYGQKFKMNYKMRGILRNTIYRNGYSASQIANNTWEFNEAGLNCLTCSKTDKKEWTNNNLDDTTGDSFYVVPFSLSDNTSDRYLSNTDFSEISVSTAIFLEITRGEEYSIRAFSEDDNLENLSVEQSSDRLKIYYDKDSWDWENPHIRVVITMPELERLRASSASTVHLKGLNQKEISMDLSSSATVYLAGSIDAIDVDASSAAKLFLAGSAKKLIIDASSSSKIHAYKMEIKEVDANVSSAASVDVLVLDYLDANASSAGKIRYKGNPNTNANASSGGRIMRD
ncbi:MAG: phage shock protein PspC (stress-responsive transcriptional regulator) [Marivirga sp.]|jgi:phage shock protein PspC (stress-responsive transcriptional regulator)